MRLPLPAPLNKFKPPFRLPARFMFKLPGRIPLRLPERETGAKWVAVAAIATLMTLVAVAARHTPLVSIPLQRLDDMLYDSFYHLRPQESLQNGNVVIVTIDEKSLDLLDQVGVNGNTYGWPWPRDLYGHLINHVQAAGAKAVAFDMMFGEQSVHRRDGDDVILAEMVAEVKVPVIFGTLVAPDGRPGPMAPPVANPTLGAVNVAQFAVLRRYQPLVNSYPSLALRAATAHRGGQPPPGDMAQAFRVHYYGPSRGRDGRPTFPYVSAAHVVAAGLGDAAAKAALDKIDPDLFLGKIVVVGATAAAAYDMKASPLDPKFPGVEYQATAMENLLSGQRVWEVRPARATGLTFAASLLAAGAILLPRQVSAKLLAAVAAAGALVALAVVMFTRQQIVWLPLGAPLLALVLTTVGAFAWSYVTEDRQRRVIFKMLEQNLSPAIAEQFRRDPKKAALGGERRDMTVMFTDVAGFTDLSETLEPKQLAALMNFYLEEMSSVVFGVNGTIDKYIGDAIMSFWNAPLDQPDHAALACRAALGMRKREDQMQADLRRLGAQKIYTRIGINSGPMAIGNLGSSYKFAYTVLGDSVNLGARLEGANKFYGSRIMTSQTTAELVKGRFVLRRLDLLRVKGKQKPMAVYELLAEGNPAEADPALREKVERYEAAWALYSRREWDAAEARLRQMLADDPEDGPPAALAARMEKLRHDPPAADWDGVYVAKDK